MIAVYAYIFAGVHHLHYDEPILRGTKDYRLPKPERYEAPFEYEGRRQFWDLFATLTGNHCQVEKKRKYMDADGAIFSAVITLMGEIVYPRCPKPPTMEECVRICNAAPAWFLPQSQH